VAEDVIARLGDVQRVTESDLAFLDLEDLLNELLDRVVDILAVDTSAILLVEDDGRTLHARAAKGLEEEVEQGFRLPIGRGFAGRVAATREPVVIPDLDNAPVTVVNPLLREKGVRSLLGVPLIVEGHVIGVLHVGSLTRRDWTDADVELLQLVADRVALSIERSRLAVQGQIAQTLQRSLLPRSLPLLAGLSMAARYLPAVHESAVGGDWYDVIRLGHRRIGLAIGDVAGHGMAAATYMGELRSGMRAYALEAESPAQLLGKLARFADRQGSRMATVIYAVLNLDTWVIELARAGHPFPLLVRPNGSAIFLKDAGGPPLGTGGAPAYNEMRFALEPGETLLLYTDGLIEQRGEHPDEGFGRLRAAALSGPDELGALCDHVVDTVLPSYDTDDDVTLLILRTLPDHAERLELAVIGDEPSLRAFRGTLRRWLAAAGAAPEEVQDVTMAANEAIQNAIEHAHALTRRAVEVVLDRTNGAIEVTVRDHGTWREPRESARGRGLPLMRALMDSVAVDPGPHGTTVTLSRSLAAQSGITNGTKRTGSSSSRTTPEGDERERTSRSSPSPTTGATSRPPDAS
jgi:serine phosphatase RsbU (regulator of sigma subunit)/anti-sigma regulatory factor (Ser/Thr protein kinase)